MNKLGDKMSESKCALVYGQMNEPPGARARVALTGERMCMSVLVCMCVNVRKLGCVISSCVQVCACMSMALGACPCMYLAAVSSTISFDEPLDTTFTALIWAVRVQG